MKKLILCILFISIGYFVSAQKQPMYLSYVFPQDSLIGFNEIGAINSALKGGYFGVEYKVFMYRARRNFINEKYGYQNINSFNKNKPLVVNTAPCLNEDFESSPVGPVSSVSGWTISEGSNSNSCAMLGCCSAVATGSNSWIVSTPYTVTATLPVISNSPLGGSKVIQLNDQVINAGEIVRLEQTFSVTTSNSNFQYAYWAFIDGTGHACCDLPYLNILFYDCSSSLITSATMSLVAPGPSCVSSTPPGWFQSTSGLSYHTSWVVNAVNLSSYIGSCVKVQVTVGDCDGWAHAGFCFFDAKCGPSITTGIGNNPLANENIKLFPNPNNGEFIIQGREEDMITITNELGQIIKTIKLSRENNYSSKINGLPAGIYFAIGKSFREKIVVTE